METQTLKLNPTLTITQIAEFKLTVNQAQADRIQLYLERLKAVWNRGLVLLLDYQQRQWRKKFDQLQPPTGMVLRWSGRRFEEKDDAGKTKIRWGKRRLTGAGVRRTRDGYAYCPVREGTGLEDPYKLFKSGSYYNATQMPCYPWAEAVPSKFNTGVHESLRQAWKNYNDPNHPAKRPRFKGRRDSLKSLCNRNAGGKSQELKPIGIVGTDNGYVAFPGIGRLHVKGLFKRFNPTQRYGQARILVEPSGYYLQVTVEAEVPALKPNDKACGIDPGVKAVVALDGGKLVQPGRFLAKRQRRLKRLQRKAARQQQGSRGWQKTNRQMAQTHEKIRRSRAAFNHKLSTKLVREFGAIAFEDTKLQNMTRRPKAKRRENGQGYEPNRAKAKAGLNRSVLDVGIGDLRQKVKTKAATFGRDYEVVKAPNSSQNCYCCGQKGDRPTQSEFYCLNPACAWHGIQQQADTNAARNHLHNASFWATGKYRAWAWELKREETVNNSPSGGTTGNSETRSHSGAPPEATSVAPELEYSSQSLPLTGRELIDVESQKTEYPLNPLPNKGHKRRTKQSTRAPSAEQLSLDFGSLDTA